MEIVGLALLIIVLVRWAVIRRRLRRLDERLSHLEDSIQPAPHPETVVDIIHRVSTLERRVADYAAAGMTTHLPADTRFTPAAPASAKTPVPPAVSPPIPVSVPTLPPQEPLITEPPPTAPRLASPSHSQIVAPPPLSQVAGPQTSSPLSDVLSWFGAQAKAALDIEEVLGTNWLGKLGIAILVLGVAFFLAWQMVELGPTGKVVVGWTTGLALLGAGIWFERSDTYRVLARAGVAGGWAVLFFTAYAMYHVPATRVLSSPLQCLGLMLVVATPMVAHTLRYRSQVTSGLAFLLAFSTIAINRADVWGLTAAAILAAGLSVVALRMHWFELEIFGISATYLNHWYWLWPIIEPMKVRQEFPQFKASVAVLLLYWLIFRASYILRKPADERVSTISGLLNAFLLLAVMRYQAVHPEMAFWFLLVLGAVELMLGQLPVTRQRRTAFIVLTTLGTVLLFAAFPFRYSGQNVAVIWLIEAEIFFVVGVLLREIVFIRLGLLGTLPTFITLIGGHAARVFGARMDGGYVAFHLGLGSVFVLAAIIWYVNAHWVPRRWPELFARWPERLGTNRLSYLSAIVLLTGAWVAFPKHWSAVAWIVVAAALARVARHFELRDLTIEATFIAACAFFRVLFINLSSTENLPIGGLSMSARLLSVPLVAAGFYVLSPWTRVAAWELTRPLPTIFTWVGSMQVALLLWYELLPASVGLGWALMGLVLFEVGVRRASLHLRLQAYVAFASVFFRIVFVNFNAADVPGPLDPRIYTVVPLAVTFYYVYGRLREFERAA